MKLLAYLLDSFIGGLLIAGGFAVTIVWSAL